MKNTKLNGKSGYRRFAGKLRQLFNLKKRIRQTVSAFLVLTMLYGAFVFDLEMFKAWAQGGCGGPDEIFQNCALGGGQVETDLTNQAIDDVIAMYKLPPVSRSLIMQSMRNEVRAMLYSRLLDLINKPDKTPAEIQALTTFANRVKTLRVNSAVAARAEYDRWTQNPCGGYQPPAPYTYNSPGCTQYTIILNGAPTSPTFEEFQQYGSAIAYQGLFTPEAQAVSERTAQNILVVGSVAATGIGAAAGTAIGTNLTVAAFQAVMPQAAYTFSSSFIIDNSLRGLTQFIKVPLPASASSGTMGGVLAGGPIAVIMTAIQILVTQTINVVNQAQVPDKLNQAIVDSQNMNINLNDMVTTDAGNGELYGVFLLETLPDFPAPIAPPADPNDRPFLIQWDGIPQPFEAQSFSADLGWRDSYTTPLRLSGNLFAYSEGVNQPERRSIILRFKNWQGGDMLAYRFGGQFFVMNPADMNSGRLVPYLFLKSNGTRLKIEIKQTNMQLFETERVSLRCGITVTPDPGTDKVIGRITNAGEPSSSLTATINDGTTATVNGITIRNLRITNEYEVIGNIVATNVPAPTNAQFTLGVQNSVGQSRTIPVHVKKTSVLNSLSSELTKEGTVGTAFSMTFGSGVEVGCSNFDFSIAGDIPPGLQLESDFSGTYLRGTPTSGGKFSFVVTKSYANGESISQLYYLLIRTDMARLDDTAISWWRAEDGAADYFKRANGTFVGNVRLDTGKVNRGFNFDGDDSYIKLPDNTFSPGNSFTFETWFKTAEKGVILGSQVGVEPFGNPNGARPLIYVDHNGKLRVQMHRDQFDRFITSQQSVTDNQYHHVAVTYDWTTEMRRVYLDGVEIGSLFGGQLATGSKYQFGAGYVSDGGANTGWLDFKGVIDEPTLYSRVLNQTEIANIFKAGSIGKLYLKIRPYAPQVRDGNDGGFFMDAHGSSPPLRFKVTRDFPILFSLEQDTSNFIDLRPAIYLLTVTDSLGFQYTTSVTVPNAPPNVTVTAGSVTPPRCFGEQNGSMRVLINGYEGTFIGGTQFSVFGGASLQNSNYFPNLSGGTYTPAILDVSSNTVHTGEQVTLAQPAPYSLSPSAFPNAPQNVPYSQTFTLSGNNAPYTLSAEGNNVNNNYALPDGLTAAVTPDTITVSGTPTQSGTFPIRINYYDRNGCQGARTMNLTVVSAANVSISGRVINGGQGLPNATITLSGGANQTMTTDSSGNYSFINLPPNLDYTATVTLNGYSFAQQSLTFNAVNANIGDADFVTAFTHYEGDIAPRSTGDGNVDVRDFIAIRRILDNLDPRPANGGEWQRASVAPRSSLGKTFLDSNDRDQIVRYLLRQDPLTLVGGPSQSSALSANAKSDDSQNPVSIIEETDEKRSKELTSQVLPTASVSAPTVNVNNGAATVPVTLTSDGTPLTAVQFTVTYDSTRLTLSSVTNTNPTFTNVIADGTTPGQIKILAYRFSMLAPFPLNSQILGLNFTVNQGATGQVQINFTDNPVQRLATDANAGEVTLNSSAGIVIITPPTAAGVPVAGRVISPSGIAISRARVIMTMPNGETQTTLTNAFGYYQFEEIPAGETYVFTVEHKRFVFNPQVVSITEAIDNLDFTALSEQ